MDLVPEQASEGWIDPNIKSLDCGFQYNPLRQRRSLRLLKLLPSSDHESPIECTISEWTMEESKGQYCALSYTWDDMAGKQMIVLNGCSAFVTQNLYSALSQLRSVPDLLGNLLQPLHLWIDALCINQMDKDEKKHQVSFMKEIFANANLVVGWLGLEADGSSAIMDALDRGLKGDQLATIPRSALTSFFTRSWWTRVWIVQEYMASRDMWFWFLCGPSSTHASRLFGFLSDVLEYLDKSSYYITDSTFRDLLSWRLYFILLHERWQKMKSLPLVDLMELTHAAGATDARDRVFALLGLVGPEENLQIKLDYSLSPCEVFCSAIWTMTNYGKRSEAAMKAFQEFEEWQPQSFQIMQNAGHWPLTQNILERRNCDGVACCSKQLCLWLPRRAKPDAARVVQYFTHASRARKNRMIP